MCGVAVECGPTVPQNLSRVEIALHESQNEWYVRKSHERFTIKSCERTDNCRQLHRRTITGWHVQPLSVPSSDFFSVRGFQPLRNVENPCVFVYRPLFLSRFTNLTLKLIFFFFFLQHFKAATLLIIDFCNKSSRDSIK